MGKEFKIHLKTLNKKTFTEFFQFFRVGKIHNGTIEKFRLSKFYHLYGINERKSSDQSDTDRENGLKSIYGVMGQICHHFSWTLDYLLWEVDWRIVQRMLIDAPSYESEEEKKEKKKPVINLSEQTSEDFLQQLLK